MNGLSHLPWNPHFSAGWIVDGDKEPEHYELFRGEDSEARSRTLLIDTFTWMACDEPDKKIADMYWDVADYLVRFGQNKDFLRNIRGVTYWRKRVTIHSGGGDVRGGSPE